MKVVVAPEVQLELTEIWRWNAERWGVPHADAYLAFLEREIENLATSCHLGKPVARRQDLRYSHMRRRTKGNAHIAVYAVSDLEVTVLHVFHTAQDWERIFVEDSG